MITITIKRFVALCLSVCSFCAAAQPSKTLSLSLGEIPIYAESEHSGFYSEWLKELDQQIDEVDISVRVQPYQRSINSAAKGLVHAHYPAAFGESIDAPANLRYSSAYTHEALFVIYSRVDSERITLSNIDDFDVEAVAAHRSVYFKDHDLQTIACVECGLKRVAAGRSDGFIYEPLAGQRLIEAHQLDNLQATIIKRVEVRFLLPIGPEGDATDRMITQLVDYAVSTGQLEQKLKPVFELYQSLER